MQRNQASHTLPVPIETAWQALSAFMEVDRFHPKVERVDQLTDATAGVGAIRRCNFYDGTSVREEVLEWTEGQGYRVRLTEIDAMPLTEAFAELRLESLGPQQSRITMSMDFTVKYGPVGWLMGATVMRFAMGKLFAEILRGLEYRVVTGETVQDHVPQLAA